MRITNATNTTFLSGNNSSITHSFHPYIQHIQFHQMLARLLAHLVICLGLRFFVFIFANKLLGWIPRSPYFALKWNLFVAIWIAKEFWFKFKLENNIYTLIFKYHTWHVCIRGLSTVYVCRKAIGSNRPIAPGSLIFNVRARILIWFGPMIDISFDKTYGITFDILKYKHT